MLESSNLVPFHFGDPQPLIEYANDHAVDWWLRQVFLGNAFSGSTYLLADPGNFALIQLFNPPNSNVQTFIRRVRSSSAYVSSLTTYLTTIALSTAGPPFYNVSRKRSSSKSQLLTEYNTIITGDRLSFDIGQARAFYYLNEWFFMLDPGEGLSVTFNFTGVDHSSYFDFVELPYRFR